MMGQHLAYFWCNITDTSPTLNQCVSSIFFHANTKRWPNVGLMLAHRLRRWPNLSPTLGQRVVLAGLLSSGNAAHLGNIFIITPVFYGGPQVPPTLMQVQKHVCIFRNINASSETLMQVQKTFMQVRLKTFMHV